MNLSTIFQQRRISLITLSAAALLGVHTAAHASKPEWLNNPYSYVLINQNIRDALKEFGRNLNIPVTVSEKIRGQVRGEVRADTAGAFLAKLAEANGLIWYYDGSILYVNSSDEFATQIIDLGGANGRAVVNEVTRLNLMDDRFSIRSTADAPVLRVSGPPAFIAMVQQVVSTTQPPPQGSADDPRVRVFRGGQRSELVEDFTQSHGASNGEPKNGRQTPGRNIPEQQSGDH